MEYPDSQINRKRSKNILLNLAFNVLGHITESIQKYFIKYGLKNYIIQIIRTFIATIDKLFNYLHNQ